MGIKKLFDQARDQWNESLDREEHVMEIKKRAKNVKHIREEQERQQKGGK